MSFLLLWRPSSGGTVVTGAAILATIFDMTANSVRTAFGAVSLNTAFGLTAAGTKVFFGAANLATTFALTAAGVRIVPGAANLGTTFGLAANSRYTALADVSLTVVFTLTSDSAGGEVEGGSRMLQVDKEDLKSEPWPGFPDLPKPRVGKPAKPGYMRKRDA